MSEVKEINANLVFAKGRYAIVATRWNAYIVNSLIIGAVDTLKRHGIEKQEITVVRCPGAFELPLTLLKLAKLQQFDALIALGAIIKGGTPHFDIIAGQCTSGISNIMLEHEIPITFGVLTVGSVDQAIERAGTKMGNKGEEAAMAALEMVSLFKALE